MKLGAFEIYPVSDGRFRLDGGSYVWSGPEGLVGEMLSRR